MTPEIDDSLNRLVECLGESLSDYCFDDARCWVAFSGGLDSSVLLQAAWHYFHERNLTNNLGVIHIDHGLQQDSEQWREFCEARAQSLTIECRSFCLQLDPHMANVEQAARDGRYGAFEQVLDEGSVLLMAHHLNDQAETFLYRLMRGSGVQGLSGIPKQRALGKGTLVRPFLSVEREDLERVANACQLSWVEDPSNTNVDFDRNFIRHQVMPLLQSRWPKAAQQVAKSAGFCDSAAKQMHILAEQDWRELSVRLEHTGFSIAIGQLANLQPHRLHACLRFGLGDLKVCTPNESQFDEILKQITHREVRDDSKAMVCWGNNSDTDLQRFCARKFRDRMHVFVDQPIESQAATQVPLVFRKVFRKDFKKAFSEVSEKVSEELSGEMSEKMFVEVSLPWCPHWRIEIALEKSSPNLNVEWKMGQRVGGERSHPLGRQHSQTLKKLLQEADIPPWLRELLPLIFRDDQLIAVADLWIEQPFLARNKASDIRVCLKNTHPWQVWLETKIDHGRN